MTGSQPHRPGAQASFRVRRQGASVSAHRAPLPKGTHEHPGHTPDRHFAYGRRLVGSLEASAASGAGGSLVRRRSIGGRDARGHALAARAVAGSRRNGRGGGRASALAARTLPPLAARDRTVSAPPGTRSRRSHATHSVRARAACADWSAAGRQRDLPLDGQPARREPDREPV